MKDFTPSTVNYAIRSSKYTHSTRMHNCIVKNISQQQHSIKILASNLNKSKRLKYKKLANQYIQQTKKTQKSPNTPPPMITFAEMEVGTGINKQFGKRLNIPEFPYIQIYRNGSCVASFATGPVRNFTRIIEYTVNVELGMSRSDWDLFFERFDEEMVMGRMRLEQARQLVDELE